MVVYYRYYQYSRLATLVSVTSSALAFSSAFIGAILTAGFFKDYNVVYIVSGIGLLALATFLYFYCSKVLSAKINAKAAPKNIKNKVPYTLIYCREHPEEYDELAKANPAFGEKYMLTDEGNVVKRKAE